MAVEIFSYYNSILNPLLKLLILAVFAVGTWYFYKASKKFGGNLGQVARLLMWGGLFGCLSALFRLLGDYALQDKWMESIGGLLFALISLFVAYLVYTKFTEINEAFGLTEENK